MSLADGEGAGPANLEAFQPPQGDELAAHCRALFDQGRLDEALDAVGRLVAASPAGAWRDIRKRLAGALGDAGRWAEAVPLLESLVRDTPDQAWLWPLVARARQAAADADGARAALQRADALEPLSGKQLALLVRACAETGDLEALSGLSARHPEEPTVLAALARALVRHGRMRDAVIAFDRVIGLNPQDITALEDRDRAAHSLGRRTPPKLTIAVHGNCQAIGMAQALRRLRPDAEVVSYVTSPKRPAEAMKVAEALEAADLVITQPTPGADHPLRTVAQARRVEFPRIAFTGFHPDLFHSPDNPLMGIYHSRIVAGAFLLGVPRARALDLFNAYVYGVLGYFEEYAVAEQILIRHSSGLDMGALLPRWRGQPFVHVPHHPTITVLQDIAAAACSRAGLEVIADAELAPDGQAWRAGWPVYPEIARRLGLDGGDLVFRPGGRRPGVALDELVDGLYAFYGEGPCEALEQPEAVRTADILRREGL